MNTKVVDSIKNNYKGIILVLFASFLSASAQLLWKIGVDGGFFYIIFGFILYALTALITIAAYRFGSLSVLHPFFSFAYIFALLFSHFFLNEFINIFGILGVVFIISGSILLGIGD